MLQSQVAGANGTAMTMRVKIAEARLLAQQPDTQQQVNEASDSHQVIFMQAALLRVH